MPSDQSQSDFSVVIPVHNAERSLQELHQRLAATFAALDASFEIVFVNDGSTDSSLSVLRDLHARSGNVRVVDLRRNRGQHRALLAGMRVARGRCVVTMDDDLQHAPEDIPKMAEVLDSGYDAVFGSFEKKRHGIVANVGSRLMAWVANRLFGPPRGFRDSSFRIMTGDLVDAIRETRTPFPYVSGLVLSATDRVTNIAVTHAPRRHGRSTYTVRSRLALAYNLLINYSSVPLRLMGLIGLLASLTGLVVGSTFLVRKFLIGTAPPGWTTLVVVGSFFGSIAFLMLFVIGEYLSRILRELSTGGFDDVREHLR